MEYVSLYPHLYGYSMNKHIITEISPLSEKDCLFIVERYKTEFTYPLHNHKEYELNFVENGAGVRRIVGDSVEEIGDYDLVLLCGDNLEHVWEQGSCQSKQIREITIQFSPDLFSNNFIDKKQFTSIRKMLDRAQKGLSFPLHAVMKVYSTIDSLLKGEPGFYQFVKFLTMNCRFVKMPARCRAVLSRDPRLCRIVVGYKKWRSISIYIIRKKSGCRNWRSLPI